MKAYLEKINKEWLDDFVYMSKYPLQEMGFDIVEFDGDNFISGYYNFNFQKEDIMVGSVESLTKFYKHFNIKVDYIGYPSSLNKYYGRSIKECKVIDLDNNYPYFIKPSKDVKLFTGDIIENEDNLNFFKKYYDVTDQTDIFKCSKINIESEYRCFVYNKELVGIQYYLGDFKKYPNPSIIENMLNDYVDQPMAYTIDVGVNDKNETIIIEINDMWALGSYGMDSKIYTKMVVSRIREILM